MLGRAARERAYLEAVVDAVLLCLAFGVAFTVRSEVSLPYLDPNRTIDFASHAWLLLVTLPAFWFLATGSGLYDHARQWTRGTYLVALVKPFLYLTVFLGAFIFLVKAKAFSRVVFFLFVVFGFLFVAGIRLVLSAVSRWRGGGEDSRRRVLIVGAGDEAVDLRKRIESGLSGTMVVVGHLTTLGDGPDPPDGRSVLGTVEDLKRIVEERVVDDVVFALPFTELLLSERQIGWCEEVGVTVHLKVDFVRTLFARTYPSSFDGTPMLTVASTPHDPAALLVKRLLDVAVSFVALVLASPLMLLAALAVRLTSPGPAFFVQRRTGLNGRPFSLYKFRSMYVDAEKRRRELETRNEMSGPVFKLRDDPRITPVGAWLRRTSVDELPQLWNVLRGEMSLVGPRPPLPEEVSRYQRWQRRRLSMKPGITCLWQVTGRNRIGFEEWMKLDLAYIDNWSLKLDFKILLQTVPAILTARGAQ